MNVKICPHCWLNIPKDAKYCIHCGQEAKEKNDEKT